MNSTILRRLKLFDQLEIERNSADCKNACCTAPLTEKEIDLLDQCFQLTVELNEVEKSSLFYIAGYIAKKHDLRNNQDEVNVSIDSSSEYTKQLSRGELALPTDELFNLTCVLFCYYKNVDKNCINHVLSGFKEIYELCFLDYESGEKILRRLINCFSKAFARDKSDKLKKEQNTIKRKRLNYE